MASEGHPYWRRYTNLQHVKHEIIRHYLGGWFPILTSRHKRVLYLETHAGRGHHKGGQFGSPLVALKTLLNHTARDRILERSEVLFYFVDLHEGNIEALKQQVSALPALPQKIIIKYAHEDYVRVLDRIIAWLGEAGHRLPPAFIFVDPFSYWLRIEKLAVLLKQARCEMLINFIWRHADMARTRRGHEQNLDAVFGAGNWRDLSAIGQSEARCEQAVTRLVERLGAKYFRSMNMLSKSHQTKYVLLHVSNHPKAHELMKQVFWKIQARGIFRVRQSDDPKQSFLIEPQPDLRPLSNLVWDRFEGRTLKLDDTYKVVERSVYVKAQYHSLLRQWKKTGACVLSGYEGRVAFSKNPTVEFKKRPPL